MARLLRDARFAVRLFTRAPGFTSLTVVVLALGIGATTAIFSVVYGTFFAPLPYRDADALVMVWSQFRGERNQVSAKDFVAWKRGATAFEDLNAWGGRSVNLATADRPENVLAGLATPGFLAMMGYGHPLALGRSFTEDEGTTGRDHVVILTYRVWRDRFDGNPAIVGRQVRLDNEPYTVVGVLGEGPADHQQNKIWLPLAFTPEQLVSDSTSLYVMERLRRGVTSQQANANLAAVAAAVEQRTANPGDTWGTSVEPFRNNFVQRSTKQGLWLLLAAVGFLREGMMTALIGTVLGAAGAWFLGAAMQGVIQGLERFDPLTFVIVAGTLLGSAVVACLVPARRAASVDPLVALRHR